jgi:hypothetical protein
MFPTHSLTPQQAKVWAFYNLSMCDEKIHLSVRERRLSGGAVKPLMLD